MAAVGAVDCAMMIGEMAPVAGPAVVVKVPDVVGSTTAAVEAAVVAATVATVASIVSAVTLLNLTVTSRESLTLCRFTAVRREIATIVTVPAHSASRTITTPTGPVRAIAQPTAPNRAAAGKVSNQP